MKQLLGGGAAALVGSAIPVDLSTDEMALLEERVSFEFDDGVVTITNLTNDPIEVRGVIGGSVIDSSLVPHSFNLNWKPVGSSDWNPILNPNRLALAV